MHLLTNQREPVRDMCHITLWTNNIDVQNNVEQVVWDPFPQRPLIIRVTAQKILKLNDKQDFALAWSLSLPYKGDREL